VKKRILERQEIQAQQPVELSNVLLDPADKTLPAPRGKLGEVRKPKDAEALELERTRLAGGLIDGSAKPGKATRTKLHNSGKRPYKTLADNSE
jgi:hypothetical protein